ncbi:MAG TPA: CotH kinase family protein, partial [Chitinophagales bacterium]|nr:CotH kinase family protein [Chitinophagales bacterium]
SENDFILKAEYLDYSLMKNAITYEMYRKMGRYAPRSKYCEVMVNGEYKGVYSLTEKIKRDENRVDIAQLNPEDISGEELTGGYIFEINENYTPNDWESDYLPINYASCGLPVAYKMVYPRVEEIQPEQLDYIMAYVDSFEDALYGDEFLDEANGYRNFISVKSFVDFLITNEFSANYDSYGRSTFLHKDKNGEINIGPAWDYDRAFAPWDVSGWVWENTHPAWPFPFWWSRLQDDEEWRNEVYCRYNDVRQHILTDENITAFIDSVDAYIGDAAARNFLKWQELGVGDPEYFVTELRDFIDARLNWMDITLAADFVPASDASFTSTSLGALTYAFTPFTTNADYLWNFGDGTQSTEENPIHTFSSAGDYLVSLTVNKYYGCIGNSDEMFQANVSIVDMGLDGITIFPNPATDFIQVESNNNVVINETALFTVEGKYIETKISTTANGIVIDLKNVAAGTYLLKIKSGETLINYPFIKY